jgi:hypothetical protein
MARGDLIDVGYGQMASPRTMCKSGFVWRYANTSSEAINTNSDIIEIFPYILRTATNYTPYSNDLRNSYVQITIGSTTTTQNLKSKYNFGNVSPINTKFYLTSEYNSSNPFGYGTPDSTTYVTTRTEGGKTIYGARFTVPHNADGTAPTVSVKWHMTNSSSHSDIEKVESLTLDTIPRTSKPTCSNVTLGSSVRINTNRASTSFTHTINIKVGGTTRETFNNIGEYKDWTPSYSTYLPIISGTSATATIECITYSGSTNIGTASTTCVISVPDNATTKPTASISIAKGDNVVPASWGVYVKGKSKLAVTISGTPKAGTSIASYSSVANGSTYTTSTYTTAELTGSGSVTGFVKDARGFQSANATPVSYTVVDYANPQITTATVARCTSNGTLSDEGTYVKYSFVGSISPVSNKNSKTFTLKYKVKTASSWTTIATWTSAYTLNQLNIVYGSGGIDITKEYVFRFEATDSFTTTAKEVEVGTVADIFNFNPSGKSLAIGGVSTREDSDKYLDVFMTLAVNQIDNTKSLYWKEYGFGDKFKIVPAFSGSDNDNKLKVQGAVGGAGTDPTLYDLAYITGKDGNVWFKGNLTSGSFFGRQWGLDTNNTTDTWVPVAGSGKWQHRVIPTAYNNEPSTLNVKTLEAVDGRITNANITHYYDNNKAHCKLLLATASMTSNKPMADGYILCFNWDNNGQYVGQLYIPNNDPMYAGQRLQFRGCNNGTWGSWQTIPLKSDFGSAMLRLSSDYTYSASAWANTQVAFSGRSSFTNSNSTIFEQSGNGIKCKFAGWVQISGVMTVSNTNQFDATLLKGSTQVFESINTAGRQVTLSGIVQVAANDILYLAFNSSNKSGTMYHNTSFTVTRVS